ncbi:MAG: histidine phosphatase family protein, partial [Desulfobulbaceae bacterium]|nr:histidine phosphatase family protein [Desulfobulbaceae bacterium]
LHDKFFFQNSQRTYPEWGCLGKFFPGVFSWSDNDGNHLPHPAWYDPGQQGRPVAWRTDEPLHAEGLMQIRLRDCGRKVLLVTHLIVARCLILHYSGRPPAHFRSIKVDNGDVSGFDGLAFLALELFRGKSSKFYGDLRPNLRKIVL